jgi:transcriptional regulator with XRE-family HTH domain
VARKLTQAELAERISVSRDLIVRMEKGDPGVAFGFYATALWSFNLLSQLVSSVEPVNDAHGTFLRHREMAQRVRDSDSPDDPAKSMDF